MATLAPSSAFGHAGSHREKPHSSVEAMAADYLKEIKARRQAPLLPMRLFLQWTRGLQGSRGFGLGVKSLRRLFDTLMSPLRWPVRSWLSIIGRRIARLSDNLRAAPPRAGAAEASLRGFPSSLPTSVVRVAASALVASARYRPGFYCGQLTLFTPLHREPGLPSLEAIWRRHARAVSIVETRGDHSTMLSPPNADSTAASLTAELRRGLTYESRPSSLFFSSSSLRA
jgi:hypothetical protein